MGKNKKPCARAAETPKATNASANLQSNLASLRALHENSGPGISVCHFHLEYPHNMSLMNLDDMSMCMSVEGDISCRNCVETELVGILRDLAKRPLMADLVQKSCLKTSPGDPANRALIDILYRDLARRPLMEILSRDLVKRAAVLLRDLF